MKNKKLLSIISVLLFSSVLFAEDYHVNVTQNPAIPGGKDALDAPAPTITWSNLSNGNLNLRYNFNLDAKKDNKDKLINCKIGFPSGVSYSVTAIDGVQGFEFDGEQVPALVEHTTYAEFFIPVRKNGSGFIEIQLSVPRNYVGFDIPITIDFEGYKKEGFFSLWSFVPAVGTFIDVGRAIHRKITENDAKRIEEQFEKIKKEYKKFSLSDSLKRYRLQIR